MYESQYVGRWLKGLESICLLKIVTIYKLHIYASRLPTEVAFVSRFKCSLWNSIGRLSKLRWSRLLRRSRHLLGGHPDLGKPFKEMCRYHYQPLSIFWSQPVEATVTSWNQPLKID